MRVVIFHRLSLLDIGFVEVNQGSIVAAVGGLDRRDVLVANNARLANRRLRPDNDSVSIPLQPNISHQSSPAAIAVEKRMNGHRSMMQPRGLLDPGHLKGGPTRQVVEQHLQVARDSVKSDAYVEAV